MTVDYTKLLKKLVPESDGQAVLRLLVGVVSAIDSGDGTVDVTLNGVTVPDVPVLGGAYFAVASTVQILSYRGSLLIIGSSASAAARPVETLGSITNGGLAQTTYTNTLSTTGIHGVAFVAPPSGRVQVFGRAMGGNAVAGQYTLLDYEVKTGSVVGSGSSVRATSNDTAGIHQSATANSQGTMVTGGLVSGLTPGSLYNAALTYSSTGTAPSSQINRRYISVVPQ